MSATITLQCDRRTSSDGPRCARNIVLRAVAVGEARADAHRLGWRQTLDGRGDICPVHSGAHT